MTANITTILLAAGQSQRMGASNKLLLPIGGIPMIRHMVQLYQAATNSSVLVVTGHDAEAIETTINGTGARMVFNPSFAQGQQTSVACGLRSAEVAKNVLIGLGDQPLLTVADVQGLIAAHYVADSAKISIPVTHDLRGNPIIVPAALRARMLADPKGAGCKQFTRTQLDHVQTLPLPALGFYTDVDTPEAYAKILQSIPELLV
ncbi:MAG: nucleotidyltransferase family protein [Sulfitobacter sp.]